MISAGGAGRVPLGGLLPTQKASGRRRSGAVVVYVGAAGGSFGFRAFRWLADLSTPPNGTRPAPPAETIADLAEARLHFP